LTSQIEIDSETDSDDARIIETARELPTHRRAHAATGGGRSGFLRALRSTPPGLSPFWRRFLVGVIVLQVVLIATVAIVTAFRFPYWAPTDEEAHFSYIQQVADHGSLPVLGKTETSLQGLAIAQGKYPRPTTIDPKRYGLGGLSYEAFQPPLYYFAAVPAFSLTSNFVDKIYAVRLFDVVLLLAAVALAGRLARAVLKDRWMIGWAMVMVFLALPGVVVRVVTISNGALALPLTILFATELWMAWKRHSARRLVVAGALGALCVLTELELVVLLPVFALVLLAEGRRRAVRTLGPLIIAAVVPLVLVAPWLYFNHVHYHMLTAGPIAIQEQMQIINPHHLHYSLSQLPNDTAANLLDPALPAEWYSALANQAGLYYLYQLLDVLIVPAGLVLILALSRRIWSIRSAILGLPWVLLIFEMWYIRYGEQWNIYVRYTYPTLPLLLVLVAMATDTIRARYLPVIVTAGATISVGLIWGFLIFVYHGSYALR
jgi:hypothetical protein